MGPYEAPGMSRRSVGYPITDFSTLAHHVVSQLQLTNLLIFTEGFGSSIPRGDAQLGQIGCPSDPSCLEKLWYP